MPKIDCTKCKNYDERHGCKFGFRRAAAANAGGAAVDCEEDVWFCQDYDEKEEDEYNESND